MIATYSLRIFKFVKRGYCNAGVSAVCLSVSVCQCIILSTIIIHGHNNTEIVKKYHRNRYYVKVTKFVENL